MQCSDLAEVVGTAPRFFRRTAALVFNPLGDGWPEQRYNARPLLRYVWRDRIRSLLMPPLRRRLARGNRAAKIKSSGYSVAIISPRANERVEAPQA